MPDVPNWINWLAAIGSIFGFTALIFGWIWRRGLGDFVAKRNRAAALRRVDTLREKLKELKRLENDPIACAATFHVLWGRVAWSAVLLAVLMSAFFTLNFLEPMEPIVSLLGFLFMLFVGWDALNSISGINGLANNLNNVGASITAFNDRIAKLEAE